MSEAGIVKLTFQGTDIRVDQEMVSLTDMWKAGGSPPNKRPTEWVRYAGAEFVEFIGENLKVGNAHVEAIRVVRGGNAAATWAHWQIAMAYAKYLSPAFHAWCNEVVRAHMTRHAAQPNVAAEVLAVVQVLGESVAGLVKQYDAMVRRQDAFEARLSDGITSAVEAAVGAAVARTVDVVVKATVEQAVEAKLANDPRVAVQARISARELLDEDRVESKGRRPLINRISNALMRACLASNGEGSLVYCARTGTRLFSAEYARKWMRNHGRTIVENHRAKRAGQLVMFRGAR